MSVSSTPTQNKENKKRTLSSPLDSSELKKTKHNTGMTSMEPPKEPPMEPSVAHVHETIPMANVTFTEEHIATLTAVIMDSVQAQSATLVKGIVEGVLFGLRDQITSLEKENKMLKTTVTELQDKIDKGEQYSYTDYKLLPIWRI